MQVSIGYVHFWKLYFVQTVDPATQCGMLSLSMDINAGEGLLEVDYSDNSFVQLNNPSGANVATYVPCSSGTSVTAVRIAAEQNLGCFYFVCSSVAFQSQFLSLAYYSIPQNSEEETVESIVLVFKQLGLCNCDWISFFSRYLFHRLLCCPD